MVNERHFTKNRNRTDETPENDKKQKTTDGSDSRWPIAGLELEKKHAF